MAFLAAQIAKETQRLEAYMREEGLAMPAFDGPGAPADYPRLPDVVAESRRAIISASAELKDLATGPRETVRWGVWDFIDIVAFQILCHFEIPNLVPETGKITLSELEEQTALDGVNLARLLRLAMTRRVFCEPEPGAIAHTAASRLLSTAAAAPDADMAAWVGVNSGDFFPAAAHALQALLAHPEAASPLRTGFNHAWATVDVEPMFTTMGRDPPRARRMARAMASLTGGEGYEVRHLVDGTAATLAAVEAENAGRGGGGLLVDLGGSHGFACVDLARRHRRMRFVVQDLPRTVASAPVPVCDDAQVATRIEFMAHDFFTEQVVKGADVYLLRWIMHNNSTPNAVRILKSLVPALKPGARVVINDQCLREPGAESEWDERLFRRMDVLMLCLLNSQIRTEDEFRALFAAADPRFAFKGATRPPGSRMSIIEAVWEP